MLQKVQSRKLALDLPINLCAICDLDQVGASVHHDDQVISLAGSSLSTPESDDIGLQGINHFPCAGFGRRVSRQIHIRADSKEL